MVCKNWFSRPDWYYIGTILVCTKSKMTNRFKSTHVPVLITAVMSAEDVGAQIETVIPGHCPSLSKSCEAQRESQTFVDVLAAEDVGRFPDRNVTEAFSVLVARASHANSARASEFRSA
jgi:hypothetical protein